MGKLGESVLEVETVLLGWSQPFAYEAGEVGGTKFAAGRAMKVWVTPPSADDLSVVVCKVKSAHVDAVYPVVSAMGRGVRCVVKVIDRGERGYECVGVDRD